MLLPESGTVTRAAALYHDNVSIERYLEGLGRRRFDIRDNASRFAIVLPWNAHHIWATLDRAPAYPGQSETAGAHKRSREDRSIVWGAVLDGLVNLAAKSGPRRSVRVFGGRTPIANLHPSERALKLVRAYTDLVGGEPLSQVPSLPDCWIWVSEDFLGPGYNFHGIDESIESFQDAVAQKLASLGTSALGHFDEALTRDHVRVLTVSRSRYNERYRGRLLTNTRALTNVLLHSALCMSLSQCLEASEIHATWSLRSG